VFCYNQFISVIVCVSFEQALEDTYLKNANAIYSYETSDGAVKVDIGAMKLRCGGTEINVRRLDLSKPQSKFLYLVKYI